MDNRQESFFKEYSDKIAQYVDDRILLLRLSFVKKTSQITGKFVYIVVVMGLCLLIFLFLSVMLGFLLSSWFHSSFAGFGAVTGLFIIALIVIIAKRKTIQTKFFGNFIIDILLEQNEDKNNTDETEASV